MNKYAVAYISFFENNLKIEIIECDSIKNAIKKHSYLQADDLQDWINNMSDDFNDIKSEFLECDSMIDAVLL